MPTHTFRNEKNKTFEILPDGDYLVEVIEAEAKLSSGGKTHGSEVLEIKLKSVEHGATFYEKLIFHPSCDWKVDTFIGCMSMASKEGEEVDLSPEGVIGCKGWVKVATEEYTNKSGQKAKINKVRIFYTDKEKFPKPAPPPEAAGDDAF